MLTEIPAHTDGHKDSLHPELDLHEAAVRKLLAEIRILTGNVLQVTVSLNIPDLIAPHTPLHIFFDQTGSNEVAEATIAFLDAVKNHPRFCGIPYLASHQRPFGDITLHTTVQLLRNAVVRLKHPNSPLLTFENWVGNPGEEPTQPAQIHT